MKSTSYICILSIVSLIFQNGVGTESPSMSSWNLIPYIIANGEFVQKNFIDSNLDFNQTLPWINVDLTVDANGSNCSRDIQLLARSLKTKQTWALKTLDAWGKVPSGIMQGNIYWIGSVYECAHHLRGLNNSIVEQPFQTRTCLIGNSFMSKIRSTYGICVPQSCNASDLVNYINTRTIRIPFIQQYIHLNNDSIRCIDSRSFDTKAILTIVLLSLIVAMILLFTGMHIAIGHQYTLENSHNIRSGYETLVDQTTTTTAEGDMSITTTTAHPIEEHDEEIPLIVRPEQISDARMGEKLINSCSLINNYRSMKKLSQPETLACLNGIRVLSLWWIILAHTFAYAAFYSDNALTIFNWIRQFWFQIIIQAVFSIDSFFLLSGLLASFLFFVSKIENEQFSILRFLINHYIYRYLRYTIFYAIILLIYIALSPYLGQGGPIYPKDGTESSACKHTWWRNLLYINNFFDVADNCMPISWFLATNMQFHWISPLFLLAASWKWFLGMIVAVVFIIVDIVTTSVIVSKNNYDHGMLSELYSNHSNWSHTTHNYVNDVYVKPWCRIAPYAVGLLLGHILYELHQRANTLSWESILPSRGSIRFKHFRSIFAWTVALIILGLCIFGTYGDYNGHPLTRSGRITFQVLARLGWAIGLSIIIVLCYTGRGGIANKFLSNSIFHFLAKLNFGAYLWHSLVVFVSYLSRDQPVHYTVANILFNTILHILISYILSFITFLLFEIPIIQLLKINFQRRIITYN
ncbi:hypothetical protein I4U23_025312 [Adineta vaga]|nr:hypothetical protein I4U23_025312 [Adineta vaga]